MGNIHYFSAYFFHCGAVNTDVPKNMWDEGISQDLYADNLSDVTSEWMSVTSLLVIVEVTMHF